MHQSSNGWLGVGVLVLTVGAQFAPVANAQVVNSGPDKVSTANITLQATIPTILHSPNWKGPPSVGSTVASAPGNVQVVYRYTLSNGTQVYVGTLRYPQGGSLASQGSQKPVGSLEEDVAHAIGQEVRKVGGYPTKTWTGTMEISTLLY